MKLNEVDDAIHETFFEMQPVATPEPSEAGCRMHFERTVRTRCSYGGELALEPDVFRFCPR